MQCTSQLDITLLDFGCKISASLASLVFFVPLLQYRCDPGIYLHFVLFAFQLSCPAVWMIGRAKRHLLV